MRIGIYGGSFDPVHYAHLLLAECAREQCQLDELWLLPAATAPHKQDKSTASAQQRIEMLRLAIGGQEIFSVCTMEIDRGGVSYTVDTLAEIQRQRPDAELFLLLGGDSLYDLANWREPGRILELATPIAAPRPDSPPLEYSALSKWVSPERLKEIRQNQIDMPLMALSSTEIRRRVREGRSIRYRLPRAVEKYIETHELYRS